MKKLKQFDEYSNTGLVVGNLGPNGAINFFDSINTIAAIGKNVKIKEQIIVSNNTSTDFYNDDEKNSKYNTMISNCTGVTIGTGSTQCINIDDDFGFISNISIHTTDNAIDNMTVTDKNIKFFWGDRIYIFPRHDVVTKQNETITWNNHIKIKDHQIFFHNIKMGYKFEKGKTITSDFILELIESYINEKAKKEKENVIPEGKN